MGTECEGELLAIVSRRSSIIPAKLVEWFRTHGRHYPWRADGSTPYEVLVAEILLKRTTARAAARLYQAFLSKYPDFRSIAEASEEAMAEDLAPVGLARQRARSLKAMARHLMDQEGAQVPSSLDTLRQVPGVGDYTARAVLSFGYGRPFAVVDSNVARVLTRLFYQHLGPRPSPATLQMVADALLPRELHKEFNWALLDLASSVCRYDRPRHDDCPLKEACDYLRMGPEARPPAGHAHASWVRQLRLGRGMTLAQLARAAGISKATLVALEAGRTSPTRRTLAKVAQALGVSLHGSDTAKGPDQRPAPNAPE